MTDRTEVITASHRVIADVVLERLTGGDAVAMLLTEDDLARFITLLEHGDPGRHGATFYDWAEGMLEGARLLQRVFA